MKTTLIFILLLALTPFGCGIKGAPMPRRDEVFIEKTLIQPDRAKEEARKKNKKSKDKLTILPKKDLR